MLIAAHTHPLARRKRVRPKDLEGETLFTYDLHTTAMRDAGRAMFRGTRGPRRVDVVPFTEATVQLVRSGRGVSIFSNWAAKPYVEAGDIVAIPLSGPSTTRHWRAVYDGRSPLRDGLEVLVEELRSQNLGNA